MILATACILALSTLFSFKSIGNQISVDKRAIVLFVLLMVIHCIVKKIIKKKPSPIVMIIISAVMGIAIYL
ncbi:hypothetical protein P261_01954 [Lachnospiraceae bacterium TWA4]|nr:hypothetical protein P261_01954 [Lachnospiraceae bacterium TWA4]